MSLLSYHIDEDRVKGERRLMSDSGWWLRKPVYWNIPLILRSVGNFRLGRYCEYYCRFGRCFGVFEVRELPKLDSVAFV